jgi:hypothetical protein
MPRDLQKPGTRGTRNFHSYTTERITHPGPESPTKSPFETSTPSSAPPSSTTSGISPGNPGVVDHAEENSVEHPSDGFVPLALPQEIVILELVDTSSRGLPLLFGLEFPSSRPPEDSHLLVTSRFGFPSGFTSAGSAYPEALVTALKPVVSSFVT